MGRKKDKRQTGDTQQSDTQMELDADFNQYLREISKNIENESNDDENYSLMINNFIEEIPEGKEEAVAQHGLGSKVLEKLLGYSSPENFEKFSSNLQSRKVFMDPKATYVLENCLKIATIRTLCDVSKNAPDNGEKEPVSKKRKFAKKSTDVEYNESLEFKVEQKVFCKELITRFGRYILNNLEDMLKSNQGNHLVRTCLLSLAGIITIKSHDKNAPQQINLKAKYVSTIDDEWKDITSEYSNRVLQWSNFADLAFDEKSSTFLQTLCQSLYNLEQQEALKKVIKSILKKCFQNENEAEGGEGEEEKEEVEEIEKMKTFSCKSSQFLLETVIQYCEEKQFAKIYKRYFKAHLLTMCDSNYNFTVQRLIDFTRSRDIFEEIFTNIVPQMSNLLQNGKTGVVLALCKACDRLSCKQGQFIQSLLKSLECERSQNQIIQCIVALMPLQVVEKKTDVEVHLHGSLILQHILHFNKPIKIVQNLLDMKPQNLSDIFCHPKGSRIADAYLESKFIGEKSREKLIKHLDGMFLKMAISRNGSHVLEKFYEVSSELQKEAIVKELSERKNQLSSSPSGKIISYKFNVEAYARHPNQWKNFISRNSAR